MIFGEHAKTGDMELNVSKKITTNYQSVESMPPPTRLGLEEVPAGWIGNCRRLAFFQGVVDSAYSVTHFGDYFGGCQVPLPYERPNAA